MLIAFSAILGLIVGSFLNVVILRHKEKGIGGRSGCMSCGALLTWRDLIPIASWIILAGRCRHCGSRVSIQYPLVEGTTAVLFAGMTHALIPSVVSVVTTDTLVTLLISFGIIALLVMIAVYDIRHTIIPDEWSYGFASLSLLWTLSQNGYSVEVGLWGVLAALVCASPFAALWFVSRGRWMGLGDAKLALGIGSLLGVINGITAILIAFWIGALVSILFLIVLPRIIHLLRLGYRRSYRFSMTSEIPFGPYLIFGCILIWYTNLYGFPIQILYLP